MSERKNIDRLFQEKFKDFEPIPSDTIWDTIESKLDKKKKRRILPFWLKLSGVAAGLIIGFFIFNSVSFNAIKKGSPVVENNEIKSTKQTEEDSLTKNNSLINNKISIQNKNNSVTLDLKNKSIQKQNETSLNNKSNSITQKKKKNLLLFQNSITVNSKNPNPAEISKIKNQSEEKINTIPSNKNQIVTNSNDSKTYRIKEIIDLNNKNPRASIDIVNIEMPNSTIKNAIIENENLKVEKIDTTKIAVVTNVLEELLNEKESKSKVESKINRWQITSNVAPIFLGSVSNGSPIDSAFVNNGKDYNTQVGIGVGVSYAINKRLAVRTGINKLDLNYNTNDIAFYPTIGKSNMRNINFSNTGAIIHVENYNASSNNLLPFENTIVNKNKGYLNQKIGYFEVPLEFTYTVVDKKIGLKLISGISTLFLNDNSVSVVSSGITSKLGEANNLNDVHFSTNIGMGIKYGFLKSFEANIEPMFKYQINTFSANSGNFKPFLWGLYTGFSYSF